MKRKGGGKGRVVQAVGMCDLEQGLVGGIALGDVLEVYGSPRCWSVSLICISLRLLHAPCSKREVPSGMNLIKTLRRRYMIKPYSGDDSSYLAIAFLASWTPLLPRASSSTESLETYFNRNLITLQHSPIS